MPWIPITVGVAANYLAQQGGGGVGADPAAALKMADPFAPYRANYAGQLNQLMANPAAVTTFPMYSTGLAQGQQAIERQFSATGQQQSGQEQIGLQQFGLNYFNEMFNQQFNRLAQLSGASQSPAVGAQAALGASQQNMQNWSQLGGAVGYGLNRLFGGASAGGAAGGSVGGAATSVASAAGAF